MHVSENCVYVFFILKFKNVTLYVCDCCTRFFELHVWLKVYMQGGQKVILYQESSLNVIKNRQ